MKRIKILLAALFVACMALLVVTFIPQKAEAGTPIHYKAYQVAKNRYLGASYYAGGLHACKYWQKYGIDCSCLVRKSYWVASNGSIRLPDHPGKLWNHTHWPADKTRRYGDIVFYKEGGANHFTHVGMYAGKRNGVPYVIHASTYWKKVVIKPMRWRGDGFVGVRRVKGARQSS